MRGSLRLGSIAGIRIFVHWTFAILIVYILFSNFSKGYSLLQTVWSLLFVLSIFCTVFLHELGHALTAKRYNIKTRDITLLPIGGLARLESMPEKPSEELKVAIAGPAVNVMLAAISALFIRFPEQDALPELMKEGVNAQNFLLNFFVVNLWLAVFNLIPAFPMDGGRVLRALLSMRMQRHVATNIAARIGQFLALGFIFAGFFVNPFLMFIGVFIFIGAQAEAEQTQAQNFLKGYTVRDVIMKEIPALQSTDSVQQAVNLLLNGQSKNFLVMENENAIGTLSREQIIQALSESGQNQPVRQVMNPEVIRLNENASLEEAYRQFYLQRPALMVVQSNGSVQGVVDMENILEFILVKKALAGKHQAEKNPA